MKHNRNFPPSFLLLIFVLLQSTFVPTLLADEPTVDYQKNIQPILNKYCSGCHSDADQEGDFSTETYQSLQAGIEGKPVVLPGDVAGSLLLRVLDKNAETAMPPEDEPQPNKREIELLRAWVKAGAVGPKGMQPNRLTLNVPKISPYLDKKPITAIDCSPHGLLAIGRFEEVLIIKPATKTSAAVSVVELNKPLFRIENLPGKVNGLSFSSDGKRLAIASGVSSRGGLISIFNISSGKTERSFPGHRDLIYDIEFSPTGDLLATCSYDKSIILWDAKTGQQVRTFPGHNGAVYDLAFSPDGQSLLSASADDTCKVWRVRDGLRLDTLPQPLKEEYACTFSPNNELIASVGADKKLRIWKHVSQTEPKINPQLFALFAHEAIVSHLLWRPQGTHLVSFADNGVIKLWDANDFREVYLWDEKKRELISSVAFSPDGNSFFVARLDGSLLSYRIPGSDKLLQAKSGGAEFHSHLPQVKIAEKSIDEQEPNQAPTQAQRIDIPVKIVGKIQGKPNGKADFDLYRFSANKGAEWLFEIRADRDKSPLDSHLEVLTSKGEKLKRINLQAVRESYFTFRGKDSNQASDFRIFNWNEMKIKEYLYANGEVTRFYHLPRGADSGFNVFPYKGNRWGYFDTTPLAHALGEPCYIVEPIRVGEEIVPNGLPVFPIYFENDDASYRDAGKDSRLFFTAPETGEYLLKVSDIRGYEGEKFTYNLEMRVPKRDFSPRVLSETLTISPGSRQDFQVGITRSDGYRGPVRFDCTEVPEGIQVSSPIIIEEDQIEAQGVISINAGFKIDKELASKIKFSATATIDGKQITHPVKGFKELKAGGDAKLTLHIVPAPTGLQPISAPDAKLLEFVIHPGETVRLKVIAKRNDFKGPIPFGREDSSRNLPFGTYIDNIGLNGLLITENSSEREFFITCDPVTKPQSRLFHLRTTTAGGHASQSVMLHVRKNE